MASDISFLVKVFFTFFYVKIFFMKRRLFSNVVVAFPAATSVWRTWSGRRKRCGAEAGRIGGGVGGREPEKRGHDLAYQCSDLRELTPGKLMKRRFRTFLKCDHEVTC